MQFHSSSFLNGVSLGDALPFSVSDLNERAVIHKPSLAA